MSDPNKVIYSYLFINQLTGFDPLKTNSIPPLKTKNFIIYRVHSYSFTVKNFGNDVFLESSLHK